MVERCKDRMHVIQERRWQKGVHGYNAWHIGSSGVEKRSRLQCMACRSEDGRKAFKDRIKGIQERRFWKGVHGQNAWQMEASKGRKACRVKMHGIQERVNVERRAWLEYIPIGVSAIVQTCTVRMAWQIGVTECWQTLDEASFFFFLFTDDSIHIPRPLGIYAGINTYGSVSRCELY